MQNKPKLYKCTILENYDDDCETSRYIGIVIANDEEEAIDKALKDCGVVYASIEVEETTQIDDYKIKLEKIK